MDSQDDGTVTFGDLQIHPSVLQALNDVGYESPSPIQSETIPKLLAGSDVVGLSQTGSGKTAAFALPAIERVERHLRRAPQVLILCPDAGAGDAGRGGSSARRAAMKQFKRGVRELPIYGGAKTYDRGSCAAVAKARRSSSARRAA